MSDILVVGLNSQRSFQALPPKSHRLPLLSDQLAAASRAPGTLLLAATPCVPYTPFPSDVLPVLLPLIHVHILVVGLNSQRSLRKPFGALPPGPHFPPKSQKLPLLSIQLTAPNRPPVTFVVAGAP